MQKSIWAAWHGSGHGSLLDPDTPRSIARAILDCARVLAYPQPGQAQFSHPACVPFEIVSTTDPTFAFEKSYDPVNWRYSCVPPVPLEEDVKCGMQKALESSQRIVVSASGVDHQRVVDVASKYILPFAEKRIPAATAAAASSFPNSEGGTPGTNIKKTTKKHQTQQVHVVGPDPSFHLDLTDRYGSSTPWLGVFWKPVKGSSGSEDYVAMTIGAHLLMNVL